MTAPGLGLRSFSRQVGATFGRQIVAAGLSLLTVALIARLYDPEGIGTYTVALLLPTTLTSFLNLGVAPANVYFLGSGQITVGALLYANARIVSWLSVIGLGIGATLILGQHAQLFPGVSPAILWLALATFPLAIVNTFLMSVFQGLQRFNHFNRILLAQPIVLLALVFGVAVTSSHDLALLIGANLLAQMSTLVMACTNLWPLLKGDRLSKPPENFVNKALIYGWKTHLSNVLVFVNYRIDIFLVNLLLGPAPVGIYVIAVSLAERLWMVSQSVSTVLLPRLSQLVSDEAMRRQLTPLVARWVLALTAAGAVVVALVGKPFISAVFGREFLNAYTALLILLPGIVAGSAARVLANDIAARGRPELNLPPSVGVVLVNIFGNAVLIPILGLTGAAITTTAAYTLDLVLRLVIYVRTTKCRWIDTLLLQRSDLQVAWKTLRRRT